MRALPLHSSRPILVTVLTGLALALGATGCGNSDGPADESAGVASTDSRTASEPAGGAGDGSNGGAARDGVSGGGASQEGGALDGAARNGTSRDGDFEGTPTEPQLVGDRADAESGAEVVDRVYENLTDAVKDGIAKTGVPVGDTLELADGTTGLASVCALLSEDARDQTVTYAKRSAGLAGVDWNCEKAMALLLRRTRGGGSLQATLNAEVVGVNVDGNRATATIRFGGTARTSTVALVKEDGEWKLAASPGG